MLNQNKLHLEPFAYTNTATKGTVTNLKHAEKILESAQDFSDLTRDELNEITFICEKSALNCRAALAGKREMSPSINLDLNMQPESQYHVSVTYENNVLIVTAPLTFKKYHSGKYLQENYTLSSFVKLELLKHQDQLEKIRKQMEGPLVVVIMRIVLHASSRALCDNDNLENGRIVNDIFDFLNQSDNVSNMDLYSCVRECERPDEQGMKFIVFQQKNIHTCLKYIR